VSEATGRPAQRPHRVQVGNVWKCSNCEDFVWSDTTFCQHCKAVFAPAIPYTRSARRRRELRVAIFRVIAVLVIGAGLFWLVRTGRIFQQRGRVRIEGLLTVAVVDRSTFSIIEGMPFPKIYDLSQQGKVFLVANGTELVVLDDQPPYSRVRLTNMWDNDGRPLWIQTKDIRLE
jgi:hypothetical protein